MMSDLGQFGRLLLGVGGVLILVGILCIAIGRVAPGGRLPGDLAVTRGSASCLIPLATSLLLSIVLTLLLNLWTRR
jgi:hypothetical protein